MWHLPPHIAQARFTLRNREGKVPGSSVVERSAVNRLVVGSNPTAGAKFLGRIIDFIRLSIKSRANEENVFESLTVTDRIQPLSLLRVSDGHSRAV